MIYVDIDERTEAPFRKRLKQADDETLTRIFTKGDNFIYEYGNKWPRIFTDKAAQLKTLFPVNFDAFKQCYEQRMRFIPFACSVLTEMIFIEYAPVNFSDWSFLDKYFTPDSEKYTAHDVTSFMIAAQHKDVAELREKINNYPLATNVLLPALIDLRTTAACETLIDIVETSGLEDSLRYSVFDTFLSSGDVETLGFFTERAIADRLARFKSLKEAMTHTDIEYAVKFTADEYLKILDAVARGDYEKYLKTSNGAHRLLCLGAVARFRANEFGKLAERLLATGDGNIRRSVLYAASSERFRRTEHLMSVIDLKPTVAEFAALTDGWSSCEAMLDRLGAKFARKFFDVCLYALDAMKKLNNDFRSTDVFPVSTHTYKSTAAILAIESAAYLDDAELARMLDERYYGMNPEAQAKFWDKLAKHSKRDKRACVIEFLKSDHPAAKNFYDKMKLELDYDEAVRVSDYLRSKKQDIKNKILNEFLRSPFKDNICRYLIGCKEGYKREIGEEMQGPNGDDLENKFDMCVLTLEKPNIEFEKFDGSLIPHIDGARVKKLYDALEKFVDDNKDYEYASPHAATKLTVGATYCPCEYGGTLKCYPLWEKVKAIYDDALDANAALDLYVLTGKTGGSKLYSKYHKHGNGQQTAEALIKKKAAITTMYVNYIVKLYIQEFGDSDRAAEHLYAMYKAGLLEPQNYGETDDWQSSRPQANELFPEIVYIALRCDRDNSIKKIIELADADVLDIDYPQGALLIAKAYERGLFAPEYLEYLLVTCTTMANRLTRRSTDNDCYMYSSSFAYPKFREFYKKLITRCADAELERGTLKTPFNSFIRSVNEIYGVELFAKAIVKIRGLTLVRNSGGYWWYDDKNHAISKILKTVRPKVGESFDDFERIINEYGITRDELVRAAVYNLNFLDLVDRHLGVAGFKSAVLYFAAHLNEALSESRIEQIKEYSTIDYNDFKDGAFDFDWYAEMIKTVPPDEFKRIYDNAKYITVAGLHKRAQRFFDAINGRISASEAREHILSSRNKDYCLVYSLIPLNGDEDLFERYKFFAEFLKASKKFGSQRQLSERRTVDIAFDNLARNAGYTDSSVFVYEMESRDRRVIDMYDGMTVDGYTLCLDADCMKVRLIATDKNGKKQSSIPAAIAKTPQAVEIAEYKKSEEQKRKRLKRSLEEAMENQTDFTREQILRITKQPLIRAFFEKLVLTDGTNACMLYGESFIELSTGKQCTAKTFKIAHPVTLKQNGTLRAAMRHVIEKDIKQPFKQVFREIYVMSDGERDVDEVWRFKGFNVDLKKAIAALKSRRWGVSEDIGLRKVYYKHNTVATIFREFDHYYIYDFDNKNRELESIMFIDRHSCDIKKLDSVDPVVFSETLRDVDLMIAISANNVYDFDLAMSTFEMRRAMLGSMIDILGLKNVTFLKENIKILGKYGTYVINIRTGLTFKEGKGNLLIKTIDNYDKPLALDFIDEDPMTADIVTKTLILSADADIKDPSLLMKIV